MLWRHRMNMTFIGMYSGHDDELKAIVAATTSPFCKELDTYSLPPVQRTVFDLVHIKFIVIIPRHP